MADISNAAEIAEPGEEPETELRTFLIADVRGYTRFTMEHGDEAAAKLASRFAALAREAVSARGGQVIELRGDEALAVFSSARQALRAAVDFQQKAQGGGGDDAEAIPMGIGLDAGEAVRVEGGYRGTALNLAARLCSLAGPGEVLASEGVAHLARKTEGIGYVERGPVELKGMVDPVRVVQVVSAASVAEAAAGTPGAQLKEAALPIGGFVGSLPSGPLVAREEELTAITSAIGSAVAGTGQVIMLAGQRGIGKTRLAQEATLIANQEGFLVATGRCYEPESGVHFFPFVEALTMACASVPPALQFQIAKRWPQIGQLLPELITPTPDPSADPGEEQQRLIRAISGFFVAISQQRPVALLLDDLQWADEASLRLLTHLARQTRGHRVLILGAYRDSDLPASLDQALRELSRERLVERVAVRRLTPEGTAAMVAATIGDMETSEEFMEFVHRRTRGVPFLIDEMLRSLGGHYRLIREIGAGGMGRVFQVVDTQTGKVLAAKIMFASKEASADAARRFEQEGAVLASLQHPNIVEVHGTFMQEHASCIIMELLEGRSLAEMLRSETLDLKRIKHISEQVAAALVSAHKLGIVHRDIKPDNIMVTGDDQVKVTDFGIARVLRPSATLQTIASTGMTLGTPLYMSPEQIDGRKVDGRADIYALGAVLYQMLTGRPPFEGQDPMTIAFKHVKEEPEPPRKVRPGVPKDWDALILRALAKDPADRFPTAQALGSAISALGTDQSNLGEVQAASRPSDKARLTPRRSIFRVLTPQPLVRVTLPASPLERGKQLLKSHPLVAGAAVLVVVIAAFLIVRTNRSSGTSTNFQPIAVWQAQAPGKFQTPAGLSADRQGNVYVSDQLTNHIQKLSPGGQPLAEWGGTGSGHGQFSGPAAVTTDGSGNVYVADTGNNRIQEFSPDGRYIKEFGRSGSGPGDFSAPYGVAVDANGNLYVADAGNSRVQKVSQGGKALKQWSAGLHYPVGLALDSGGSIYVSDSRTERIEKLSSSGRRITSWGKPGSGHGQFNNPSSLAVDVRGNVYVADAQNNTIQKFNSKGVFLASFGRSGKLPGQLRLPQAVAVDRHGHILVADSDNHRVQELSSSGQPVAIWIQTGTGLIFKAPSGLAVRANGSMYVADNSTSKGQVYKLTPQGTQDTQFKFAGAGGTAYTFGGVATDAKGHVFLVDQLNNHILELSKTGTKLAVWATDGSRFGPLSAPTGVAIDGKGEVYVADSGNDRLIKFSSSGKPLSSWGQAGNGPLGFAALGGVAVSSAGHIYVVDGSNNFAQELSPKGTFVRQWGSGGVSESQFRSPSAIAVDKLGDVYVADSGNNRIQEFSASGSFLRLWGAKGSRPGQFSNPQGIAVDGRGNIYVADTDNRRIEKFGAIVTGS